MEAKVFAAVNMTDFATCFLSWHVGGGQGLVNDKRWVNMLET